MIIPTTGSARTLRRGCSLFVAICFWVSQTLNGYRQCERLQNMWRGFSSVSWSTSLLTIAPCRNQRFCALLTLPWVCPEGSHVLQAGCSSKIPSQFDGKWRQFHQNHFSQWTCDEATKLMVFCTVGDLSEASPNQAEQLVVTQFHKWIGWSTEATCGEQTENRSWKTTSSPY